MSTTRCRRRRRVGRAAAAACAAGLGIALTGASIAFACTNIMGPLTLTPSSGPVGTTVTTSAQGLVPRAKYGIHFAKTTSGNCMNFTESLTLGRVTTDAQGAWSNVAVTIPAKASMGTHSFCGMELTPVQGQTGTAHLTFTVT